MIISQMLKVNLIKIFGGTEL